MVGVSKGKLVLTNSVLYSRKSLYEFVMIPGENTRNLIT